MVFAVTHVCFGFVFKNTSCVSRNNLVFSVCFGKQICKTKVVFCKTQHICVFLDISRFVKHMFFELKFLQVVFWLTHKIFKLCYNGDVTRVLPKHMLYVKKIFLLLFWVTNITHVKQRKHTWTYVFVNTCVVLKNKGSSTCLL